MVVNLYVNTGDPRQLNKDITLLGNYEAIQATDELSITDPELFVNIENMADFNYIFIPNFGRYYYVRSKVYTGTQCLITCHVDVLASFKDEILNSQCIAERSSTRTNRFIEDPVCGDAGTIQTDWRRSNVTPFGYSTNNYVLMIAGR